MKDIIVDPVGFESQTFIEEQVQFSECHKSKRAEVILEFN
jgi:hypothetical protein